MPTGRLVQAYAAASCCFRSTAVIICVRTLVERVGVGPTGADIRLRVEGLAGLVHDLAPVTPEALRVAA